MTTFDRWNRAMVHYLRSVPSAVRMWTRCIRAGKFNAGAFLGLTHRGVLIGDLAASEHLRWDQAAGGRLRPTPRLFLMLVDCIFICNLSFDDVDAPQGAAVLVLEPTYRHSVYKRALRARGLTVIDIRWYEASGFECTSAHEEMRNSFGVKASRAPIEASDAAAIDRYMAGRLARPVEYLKYLASGWNRDDGDSLKSVEGGVIEIPADSIAVAVFLHSFDDNQYMYGSDGYPDLVEWTRSTIEACLANPKIGAVWVKPHPACADERFPSNQRGELALRKEFGRRDRVSWLERDTSLRAIARAGRVVGITHHGSVAEELVYLGVPVIAYKQASWANGYSFVRGWTTPREYLEMIEGLSAESHRPPSQAERESLIAYIKECRFKPGAGEFDFACEYRRWLEALGEKRAAGTTEDELAEEMNALSDEGACAFIEFLARESVSGSREAPRRAVRLAQS